MANTVFANGREISCKAGDGKVTAAFPDVCLSPPSPPAGPIPIPYPLFSFVKDTTSGSKTVKINGKEVMLKDKSYYKKCKGDEASTKSFGQGVITHTLGGKVYFISWSMDVEIEGENVVRHLDMTTSNHASPVSNQSAPWPELAKQAFEKGGKCEGVDPKLNLRKHSEGCPYNQTPHHLIPDRCMSLVPAGYKYGPAPTICVSGKNQHKGRHQQCHEIFDPYELEHFKKGWKFTYEKARDKAAESAGGVFDPPKELKEKEIECVKYQLDLYYKKDEDGPQLTNKTELTASGAPGKHLP
jgi:hypothetical protein